MTTEEKEKDKERRRNSSLAPLISPRTGPRYSATKTHTTNNNSKDDAPKSPTRTASVLRKPSEHTGGTVQRSPKTLPRQYSDNGAGVKPNRPVSMSVSNIDRDDLTGRKRTRIRIKTCHKTFVCALEKGQIEHSVNQLEEEYIWTRFELGPEHLVSLRSHYCRYMSAEKGGKLITSRARKQLEVFTIEVLPNSEKKFAIKTTYGEYMCALPGGHLLCNRFGPQAWETFEIEEEPFAPPVYGGNLNDIVVYQLKSGIYRQVPHILEMLADVIHKLDGHTTEGIWRISGDGSAVMRHRAEIQKGNYDCQIDNCHDAATLFKLFLRELNEPVFPENYYPNALCLAEEHNIFGIQEMLRKFDNINLKVIQFVINFLRSFLKPEYVEKTMMPANNLATVFAPTLLRCPSDNPLMQITASSSEVKFVLILLENFPEDLKEDFFGENSKSQL